MIDKYKDELLQSFLDNYSRVYLIDLEKDTIVKIQESEDAPELDPVRQKHYSEFNRVYSYTMLEPEYSQWREMMGSVENIRKVLADRNSFTLSYQMKDGRWMKVENRQGIRLHTQRGEGPPGGEREDRRGQARHPGSDHFFREETQGGKRETL